MSIAAWIVPLTLLGGPAERTGVARVSWPHSQAYPPKAALARPKSNIRPAWAKITDTFGV